MTGEALHHYRHCGSEASCHWPSLTELRNLVRPHADAYIKSLSFESLALQWLASIPIKIFHKHISYLLYINRCIYTVFIYYSLSSYVCIYIYIHIAFSLMAWNAFVFVSRLKVVDGPEAGCGIILWNRNQYSTMTKDEGELSWSRMQCICIILEPFSIGLPVALAYRFSGSL